MHKAVAVMDKHLLNEMQSKWVRLEQFIKKKAANLAGNSW